MADQGSSATMDQGLKGAGYTDSPNCQDRVYTHRNHQAELQIMLHQQWIYRTNCDFSIFCRGSVLPVHTCVLACFSPTVCKHLSEMKDHADTKQLRVNFDAEVMLELVAFMYTGLLKVSQNTAQEMLQCAEWFGIHVAIKFVRAFLHSSGTNEYPASDLGSCMKEVVDLEHGKLEIMEVDIAHDDMSLVRDSVQYMSGPVSEAQVGSVPGEPDSTEASNDAQEMARQGEATQIIKSQTLASTRETASLICGNLSDSKKTVKNRRKAYVPGKRPLQRHPKHIKAKTEQTGEASKPASFPCKLCQHVAPSRKELRNHLNQAHTPYACEECPRRYQRKQSLTKHIQRSHRPFSVWKCRHCDETFNVKHAFESHSKIVHDEKKPFSCDFPECNATFAGTRSLADHKDNVHAGLRVVCKKCGKHYARNVYRLHLLTCVNTSRYLCQECGMVFNLPGSLSQHVSAIHRREFKYPCPKCTRKFNHPRNLHRHMLIHNNIFPYVCEDCGTKFRHSSSLRCHREKKHSSQTESKDFPLYANYYMNL